MKGLIAVLLLYSNVFGVVIGSYNVWDIRRDINVISALMQRVDADVWCLQEANGRELFVDVPQIQSGNHLILDNVYYLSVHLSVSGGSHYAAMNNYISQIPDMLTVIAGDFNETPDGIDTYHVAWDLLAMHALQEHGYIRVDTPYQPGTNYYFTHGRGRLDQIWVSPDIKIIASGIPKDPWVGYPSDHAPVWAELNILEPAVIGLVALGGVILLLARWEDHKRRKNEHLS